MDETTVMDCVFEEEMKEASVNNDALNIFVQKLPQEIIDKYDNLSLDILLFMRNQLFNKVKELEPEHELSQKYYAINSYFNERCTEYLIKTIKVETLDNQTVLGLHYEANCKIASVQASLDHFHKALAFCKIERNKRTFRHSISYLTYQIYGLKEILAATYDQSMQIYKNGV